VEGLRERFRIFVPLLAAAYLGFYVFGLVMGVLTLTSMVWATIVAALCVLGLIAFATVRRLGIEPVDPDGELARAARARRENRGF
jgi:hypothetical protein